MHVPVYVHACVCACVCMSLSGGGDGGGMEETSRWAEIQKSTGMHKKNLICSQVRAQGNPDSSVHGVLFIAVAGNC